MNSKPCDPIVYLDMCLPEGMTEYIQQTLKDYGVKDQLQQAHVREGETWVAETKTRDAMSKSIPAQCWIAGMIWHYIMRTNHYQWGYDIESFDGDQIEYISYNKGGHYKWHHDDLLPMTHPETPKLYQTQPHYTEYNRKISFSLMLNDDYEGGDLDLLWQPKTTTTVPKKKGCIVIFDSRVNHRVRPVKSGTREVLVGWVVGPRWR